MQNLSKCCNVPILWNSEGIPCMEVPKKEVSLERGSHQTELQL